MRLDLTLFVAASAGPGTVPGTDEGLTARHGVKGGSTCSTFGWMQVVPTCSCFVEAGQVTVTKT